MKSKLKDCPDCDGSGMLDEIMCPRARGHHMRKLQYILNVLGYADVLNKRLNEDVYEFKGTDPFFITDETWDEMQRLFDKKFGGEHDKVHFG